MKECLKRYIKENMDENGVIKVLRLTEDEKLWFMIKEDNTLGASENLFVVLKFYDYCDIDTRMFTAETYEEFKDMIRECIFELKPYITFEDLNALYDYSENNKIYQDNLWLNT